MILLIHWFNVFFWEVTSVLLGWIWFRGFHYRGSLQGITVNYCNITVDDRRSWNHVWWKRYKHRDKKETSSQNPPVLFLYRWTSQCSTWPKVTWVLLGNVVIFFIFRKLMLSVCGFFVHNLQIGVKGVKVDFCQNMLSFSDVELLKSWPKTNFEYIIDFLHPKSIPMNYWRLTCMHRMSARARSISKLQNLQSRVLDVKFC